MSGVYSIDRVPFRAVVIMRHPSERSSFVVAAMTRAHLGRKASYLDLNRVFGADSLAEACKTARIEAERTGLPIIDRVSPPRRGPQGPGSPGGLRMAA